MSHRPVTVQDLHRFTVLIDARSPAEYTLDHVPGAINCPVLDDDERRIVGTVYVQQSAFEARKIGGAMVARNLARHLDERFAGCPKDWRPLVYCWRGGMRSGSFVTFLRSVGWDAQQLAGGYKAWRAHVIAQIETLAPRLPLVVLCGPTGSAKTRVLQALAARGEQVLDLEALAAHKGSVLGELPGTPQPSQKRFETLLATTIAAFDRARRVWVEAESRRIGRVTLPEPLLVRLRAAPVVELVPTREARIAYLLRDYAWLGDDRAALAERLALLRALQPKDVIAQWQAWAHAGDLPPLLDALLARHYDPLYARSQGRHLEHLADAARVEADDLSAAGIERLAAQLAARQGTNNG
jgi:tRNA 2-selenouridine synthase